MTANKLFVNCKANKLTSYSHYFVVMSYFLKYLFYIKGFSKNFSSSGYLYAHKLRALSDILMSKANNGF